MTTDISMCNDLLENIKQSLNYCCNNKQTYNVIYPNENANKTVPFIVPTKCSNIIQFQKQQLADTKTNIIYKIPMINIYKSYSIEYDVSKRLIIIDQ